MSTAIGINNCPPAQLCLPDGQCSQFPWDRAIIKLGDSSHFLRFRFELH